MRKFVKIALIVLVLLITLLGVSAIGGWIYKDEILKLAIEKAKSKFESKYNCSFQVDKANFTKDLSVELNKIHIVPQNADTLISVDKVTSRVNLYEIIFGNIQIENLELQNGYIQLVKNENGKNFDAFLKNDNNSKEASEESNYAKRYNRILEKLLNLVPSQMSLKNIGLRIKDYNHKINFDIADLNLKNHIIETNIKVTEGDKFQNWGIAGHANPREKKLDILVSSNDSIDIQIPYLEKKFGLKSGFEHIRLQLSNLEMQSGELHIDGLASIQNFKIQHPKIATKEVLIDKAKFNYRFLIGKHFVSLDTASSAILNNLKIKPYLEYNTEEDTLYKLKVKIPPTKAQTFVDALPKGLFKHFEGMRVNGNFGYDLDFEFNKNKPNRLVFDSKLSKNGLQIIKYGEADLDKLNGDFTYRAIENGAPQRPVLVGIENLNFVPYDQIPKNLLNAVLTSEDPSFFHHRGFITEAFKQSIVKNIRTKKFARGASTISMQLVKNVFLSREKTLSRKLEEILLVYILENNRIASKERMLEVYFNIIEWGPNVYGLGEASQFYFNKYPRDLTLNECLYLSSIIPKPKKFMWQFGDDGNQKSYATKHQNFIKNLMLRRALLTAEDTIGQSIPLQITGRARTYLKIKVPLDSITKDSVLTKNSDDFNF